MYQFACFMSKITQKFVCGEIDDNVIALDWFSNGKKCVYLEVNAPGHDQRCQ